MPLIAWAALGLLGLVVVLDFQRSALGGASSTPELTNKLLPGRAYALAVDAPSGMNAEDVRRAIAGTSFLEPIGSQLPERVTPSIQPRWIVFARYTGNRFSVAFDRSGNHVSEDGSLSLPWEPVVLGLPQGTRFVIVSAVERSA